MHVVALPDILDLKVAAPLQAELLAARGGPVVIDASAVQRLGGLCLQVLLSAQSTWLADGQTLCFCSVSSAFSDQWRAFGAPEINTVLPEFVS